MHVQHPVQVRAVGETRGPDMSNRRPGLYLRPFAHQRFRKMNKESCYSLAMIQPHRATVPPCNWNIREIRTTPSAGARTIAPTAPRWSSPK